MTEVDRGAFEDLYRDHYWALLRFAVRRTADRDQARDVVAETFTIAWRRRSVLPPARALPWLYRIAANVIANERRRDEHAAEAHRVLGGYSLREHQVGLAEQTEWSQALKGVLQTLHTLSDADQQVLMLHAWEGLTGRDLGAALGCSGAAASVRLHRARRRLDAAINTHRPRVGSHQRPEAAVLKGTKGDQQ